MKLVAKHAELVQKFVPRSRVKIFRNEGMRSTPLDRKPMFFCVSYYLTRSRGRLFRNEGTLATRLDHKLIFWYISYNLGPIGSIMKLGAKWADLVQKFVPRSRVGIFRNEGTRSTPLDPKLMFWCISYYLGAFGTVWPHYKTRCKTAELVQKFVQRSRVGIFRNKRTRSTQLDPKLMFWCVSY